MTLCKPVSVVFEPDMGELLPGASTNIGERLLASLAATGVQGPADMDDMQFGLRGWKVLRGDFLLELHGEVHTRPLLTPQLVRAPDHR